MGDKQGEHEKEVSRRRIKDLITEYAGGSQQEFADATGIQKANVSHYVNGTHAPGNIIAAKIASRYGLNPLWVMGFDVPKKIKSDSEKFKEWASAYNESHNPLMVSENEKSMVEKYRILDDHGRKIVDLILDEECSRCKEDRESEISLSKDELAKLPYEERLKFLRFENGDGLKLVARRNKKDVRK